MHDPLVFFFFLSVILHVPPDVTMAANFTISDSESEPSEEVEEGENNQPSAGGEEQIRQRHNLTLPELRPAGRQTKRIMGSREYKKKAYDSVTHVTMIELGVGDLF